MNTLGMMKPIARVFKATPNEFDNTIVKRILDRANMEVLYHTWRMGVFSVPVTSWRMG
jgi:hypothetical protein